MARKLFVAVHGVGDQKQFDTVQLVARQVLRADSQDYGPRLSLGTFSTGALAGAPPPPTTTAVHWHPPAKKLGFAEVYWADLCRKPDRDGFRLEAGVPWAQTLVDRVKSLKATAGKGSPEPDFELIRAVLGEMGDGLDLIGWLTKLAPQLQLPTFEVDNIVNQYLGDVQFVAEFNDIREQILERFRKTMDGVFATANLQDGDEIYLITHSEGTVVTLLGLLRAMTNCKQPLADDELARWPIELRAMTVGKQPPAWLKQIHGWMTIGSPIDKHLIMWPELWTAFENGPIHLPPQRITWWNYADCGDPIGFELDSMRGWMRDHNSASGNPWTRAFQFESRPTTKNASNQYDEGKKKEHIFEGVFTRYPWPGQAHLDYWDDNELFDHFLATVAHFPIPGIRIPNLLPIQPVLKDRPLKRMWSLTVPYLMAFVVLMAGVFFLDKGIWAAQGLEKDKEFSDFTLEVLSLSLLLAGTTVLARMPRIVREKLSFTFLALAVFTCFAGLFYGTFPKQTEAHLHKQFEMGNAAPLKGLFVGFALIVGLNAVLLRNWRWRYIMGTFCVAAVLGLLVLSFARFFGRQIPYIDSWLPRVWTKWIGLWATSMCFAVTMLWTVWENREGHSAGLWPLIGPGFTAVVGIGAALAIVGVSAAQEVVIHGTDKVPQPVLWPLMLGAVAFLFLWKLAAILFDLTFVWHRYIKQNVMLKWFRNNLVR